MPSASIPAPSPRATGEPTGPQNAHLGQNAGGHLLAASGGDLADHVGGESQLRPGSPARPTAASLPPATWRTEVEQADCRQAVGRCQSTPARNLGRRRPPNSTLSQVAPGPPTKLTDHQPAEGGGRHASGCGLDVRLPRAPYLAGNLRSGRNGGPLRWARVRLLVMQGQKCPICERQTFHPKGQVWRCASCGIAGWQGGRPAKGAGRGAKCKTCGNWTLRDVATTKGGDRIYHCSTCAAVHFAA